MTRGKLISKVWLLHLLAVFSLGTLHAQLVGVSGHVKYWDEDIDNFAPLRNVQISIITENPVVQPTPILYTDNNGEFSFDMSVYPEVVHVYVTFLNAKVDLSGLHT